ncbi:hypothetical protein PCK1_000185 [Pneumocystis canis]|nr:hypothetical protein PCK1_000185 [Pneumocystis canis]
MPLKRRKIRKILEDSCEDISEFPKPIKNSTLSNQSFFQSKKKYLEIDPIIIESESEDEKVFKNSLKNAKEEYQDIMPTFCPLKKNKTEKTVKLNGVHIIHDFSKYSLTKLDTMMWSDKYAPLSVDDLAVSKKKVNEIRHYLSIALKHDSEKKLIILMGPAGSGKTSVINVLSREMGFEILEWRNPMHLLTGNTGLDYQSLVSKFENFLLISKRYSSLDFGVPKDSSNTKVILIEDLPNIYTSSYDTPNKENDFQLAILRYILSSRNKYPLVLIITELDFKEFEETNSRKIQGLHMRSLLGKAIIESEKVIQINFNPITKASLQKSINKIIDIECRYSKKPDSELIESIISSSSGDIRSALNTLQFIIGIISKNPEISPKYEGLLQKDNMESKLSKEQILLINSITNRDSTLGLFHAIGKVIYNKRIGDSLDDKPQNISSKNCLPFYLKAYERRPLKMNPDDILNTISVDYDTYILALHHNYLESCNNIKHADFILFSLSYSDTMLSSGKLWQYSLQQRISSLIAIMSVLMGLPSPVSRPFTSKITYPIYQKILQEKNLKYHHIIESIYENYYNDYIPCFSTMKSSVSMITEILPYQLIISKKTLLYSNSSSLIKEYPNSLLYDINDDIQSFD